jgi:hypothetical protein
MQTRGLTPGVKWWGMRPPLRPVTLVRRREHGDTGQHDEILS